MIKSFRHKGLRRFFETGDTRGISAEHATKLKRILTLLQEAVAIDGVDAPGFRTHQLSGDLTGYWAVTVRANWRIVFRFEGPNVHDVDLVDYH